MRLLAVDPGIRGCGIAMFYDQYLAAARYVSNPISRGDSIDAILAMARSVDLAYYQVDEIVIEWPQVYTAARSKGPPSDLIPLAAIGAAICALQPQAKATRVLPAEWKKQISKEVCNARVMERLSPDERTAINHVGAKDHNTIDAIGIGLYHLGRFAPRKVIAR